MQIIPAEHDARQFALIQDVAKVESQLWSLRDKMHAMAGDRKRWEGKRQVWQMRWSEVGITLSYLVEQGDADDLRHGGRPSQLLARDTELIGQMAELDKQIDAMEAEWRAEGWTRYFPCLNADGHIHASLRGCSTVGRSTAMGWATELSGMPVSTAIQMPPAGLGPRLCSVCFPDAPVEHCRSLRDITREQREAARQERADAKAAREQAKADRQAAREAKAMQPRKQTPQERRWAAMKDLHGKYPTVAGGDRQVVARDIRELAGLGKAPKWADAIEAWAAAVENEENDITWAFGQYSVYAGYAA